MNIGIVGSRKRKDRESVTNYIATLKDDDVVISGGCYGVDTWAVESARQRGLKVIEFLPQIENCKQPYEYTKAFYARNEQIAIKCDKLVAFVSKCRTGGTENTIKHCIRLGKEVVLM